MPEEVYEKDEDEVIVGSDEAAEERHVLKLMQNYDDSETEHIDFMSALRVSPAMVVVRLIHLELILNINFIQIITKLPTPMQYRLHVQNNRPELNRLLD